jgi:hypothetical protein
MSISYAISVFTMLLLLLYKLNTSPDSDLLLPSVSFVVSSALEFLLSWWTPNLDFSHISFQQCVIYAICSFSHLDVLVFLPWSFIIYLVVCFHISPYLLNFWSIGAVLWLQCWSTTWTCFMRWSATLARTSATKGMLHSITLTITRMAILSSHSKPSPLCSSAWCCSNLPA